MKNTPIRGKELGNGVIFTLHKIKLKPISIGIDSQGGIYTSALPQVSQSISILQPVNN